jgi:hypothetical protein
MATTRSMRKNRTNKRKIYRLRVRKSACRKLGRATCRRKSGCKMANGTKRRYCRKNKNNHL